jgi:hypothetical protein
MTELEVDYTNGVSPQGKFNLSLRGNGYEWKTTGYPKLVGYCPNIHNINISLFLHENVCSFMDIFNNPYDKTPIKFNETDAMKIYKMLIDHIQLSPEAMAAGIEDPNLKVARENFSKARKTRKSKSRK